MLEKSSCYAIHSFHFIVLLVTTIFIINGCASWVITPSEIAAPEIQLLDVQLDNFFKGLQRNQKGCVVHSVNDESPKIESKALKSLVGRLKSLGSGYSLTIVGGYESYRVGLYQQLNSYYWRHGLKVHRQTVGPDLLVPPYSALCSDSSKLYINGEGIGYLSDFKFRDRGITSILVIEGTKYGAPAIQFEHDKKKLYPKGRAGSYYDEVIKK